MNITTDYIAIARELIDLQQRLQTDLPYHINLVDAIGADENANSRILAGILLDGYLLLRIHPFRFLFF